MFKQGWGRRGSENRTVKPPVDEEEMVQTRPVR